ncbi:MAG: queuosine precursor transporter [Selenomonadales bacterium]|nr:queuosine precursor transporter [Selenomonadales bacterium]
MSNEFLFLTTTIVGFALILFTFRFFGKVGMYCWIVLSIIVCNIEVLKTVAIGGIVATTGNVLYGATFLATDIINEIYGPKSARTGVWLGFLAMISTTVMLQLTLAFVPHASDWAHPHLSALFSFLPRIAFASLSAYLVSQFMDIHIFVRLRAKFSSNKYIWLRNNGSTLLSQLVDSVVFSLLAFTGVFPWDIVLQITASTYLLKAVIALLDTPFVYIARHWYDTARVREAD